MRTQTTFIDYYSTLLISQSASQDEIKLAFRNLAKKLHPDKNKAPDANERFRKIFEAYEILRDVRTRNEYDKAYNNYFSKHETAFSENFTKQAADKNTKAKEQAEFYSNLKYEEFLNSIIFGVSFFAKKIPKMIAIGIMFLIAIVGFIIFGILINDNEFKGVFFLFPALSIALIIISINDLKEIFRQYNKQKVSEN